MIRTTGIINTPIGGMRDPNIYAINRDSMQMIDPAVGQSTAYQKTLLSYDPKMPVIKRGVDSRIRRNQVFGSKENRLGQIVSNFGVQDINFKDRKVVNQNDPKPKESKELPDPNIKPAPTAKETIKKWINNPLFKPDKEKLNIVTTSRGSGVSVSNNFIDNESTSSLVPNTNAPTSNDSTGSITPNGNVPTSNDSTTPQGNAPTTIPDLIPLDMSKGAFSFVYPTKSLPPVSNLPGTANISNNFSRITPIVETNVESILNDPLVVSRISLAASTFEQIRSQLTVENISAASTSTLISILSEFLPDYQLSVGFGGSIDLAYLTVENSVNSAVNTITAASQAAVLASLFGAGAYIITPFVLNRREDIVEGLSSTARVAGRLAGSAANTAGRLGLQIAEAAVPYVGAQALMNSPMVTPHEAISFVVNGSVDAIRNQVRNMGSFQSFINQILTAMGEAADQRNREAFQNYFRSNRFQQIRRGNLPNEFSESTFCPSQPLPPTGAGPTRIPTPPPIAARPDPEPFRPPPINRTSFGSLPTPRPRTRPPPIRTRPQRAAADRRDPAAYKPKPKTPPGERKAGDYFATKSPT